MMLNVGAFFNLFILLGAICAIMGFVKMRTTSTHANVSDSDLRSTEKLSGIGRD